MGAVGGILGLNGGAGGTGFSGPERANIQSPVTTQQANTAYDQNQAALAQQQALVQALAAQNGLANQSGVYNQLQNVANGTGPNPAQAQLSQATGANVANQAALAASQRGAGANIGLMQRNAANQGSAAQQQAAGQAATLQAQQSLAAMGQMGNLANQQAAQQIGATQSYTGAQQQEQQNLLNSIAGQNSANVNMQSNINSANAGLAGGVMGNQAAAIGGLFNAAGAAAGGGMRKAEGGLIEKPGASSFLGRHMMKGNSQPAKMAEGGKVPALVSPGEQYLSPTDVKKVESGKNPMAVGEKIPGKPKVSGAKNSYANDTVPKTLEEGGIVIPRSVTQSKNPHWEAMKFVHAHMAKSKKAMPKKD